MIFDASVLRQNKNSEIERMDIDKNEVFVVIPGYNEEKRVGPVIRSVLSKGYRNIIFVDDGSKDDSRRIAKDAGATVLRHDINMGKGVAAKTGCDYALKKGAKIICLMDADGQHKAEDLEKLVKKINETRADIVFGYRPLNREMPAVMKFGNWFISTATQVLQGIKLKDTQSGFRCFTAQAYKKIRWSAQDYSMESEMIANVAKNRLRFAEEKIDTVYLDRFKGTTVLDGIKIVINILKYKLLK